MAKSTNLEETKSVVHEKKNRKSQKLHEKQKPHISKSDILWQKQQPDTATTTTTVTTSTTPTTTYEK